MLTPILATKLYIPPPRPSTVLRSRLVERLNEDQKLTLISAPAGFGKTTLLSEWIAGREPKLRAAWLSLDEADQDPARFLAYLVAALQTILPGVGESVLDALRAPPPRSIELLLTLLLNDIAAVPDAFILILDDYHVIDASMEVDSALAFLVEHQPPHMRLIIASREDPRLPLARLRARGMLTELRAADLRFTPAEAAEFLNRVMGLALSADDIAALEARTEGWIVGLQLAALALQGFTTQAERPDRGQPDPAHFIQAFTGSHRFVLDYLIEEVLQRQTESVQTFLLFTSILARLCGPLCDAVSSREFAVDAQGRDGSAMLEALERGNLFVIPLDDNRQWYRYHHLFAEVLKTRLLEAYPNQISGLHRRASIWYEQNGWPTEAIQHALAGKDFARAAGLIELAWSGMDSNYQSAAWLGWAKALPEDLIRARPVLSAGYAWALLDGGELETSEAWLRTAEQWLDGSAGGGMGAPPKTMVVVDEEQFRCLPASIATARAYRAQALGDIPGTLLHARQALHLAHEDDYLRRIQATALLGIALYASGDLDAASQSLSESAAAMQKAGDVSGPIGINFVLAEMKTVSGQLNQAESIYQQSLRLLECRPEPLPVGISEFTRGLGALCCERGDLETAGQHLQASRKLAEQAALPNWQPRLNIAGARVRESQGDLDGALALLDDAERQYVRSPLPEIQPTAALKAQIWIRQGKLADAQRWAREQALSPEDDLSFAREFEHITLARLLIARGQIDRAEGALDAAVRLLERLLQTAEAGGRTGRVIEILLLQALAYQAREDDPLALAALERALCLAEPQGYCRIFANEGPRMAELLLKLQAKGGAPGLGAYVDQLLAAPGIRRVDLQPVPAVQGGHRHPSGALLVVEALSDREFDVLRLLRSEMSGPEIARELMVSLNTLRTHTKNIFSKLGVNNRRAAVRRAEELHLF